MAPRVMPVDDSQVAPDIKERFKIAEQRGAPKDALTGDTLPGEPILDWRRQPTGKVAYPASLGPHSFRVFRLQA